MTKEELKALESGFYDLSYCNGTDEWSELDVYRAGYCRALTALGIKFSVFEHGLPSKLKIADLHKEG